MTLLTLAQANLIADKALDKARNGVLGQYSGGYDTKKPYSSTVKL